MFFVHTTPEKFKDGLFSQKTHEIFIIVTPSFFEKLRSQNIFHPHENEKPAFSKSSDLKSVFEELHLRDRLVWTVDLTAEIKLRF